MAIGPQPTPSPTATPPALGVQIVAAMVNPPGPGPKSESVLLLNASPDLVKLDGWALPIA
jgi:hypothetical protein